MTNQADPLEQSRVFGGVIDVLEAIGATYSIIRVQDDTLDAAAIDTMAARLGVLGVWRALWEADTSRPVMAMTWLRRSYG